MYGSQSKVTIELYPLMGVDQNQRYDFENDKSFKLFLLISKVYLLI